MNKWSIKLFGFKLGKDRANNWFYQVFKNGSLKRARHSKSIIQLIKG